MEMAMIGLGRMGGNIVRRLMGAGHRCVVYDKSADAVRGLAGEVTRCLDAGSFSFPTLLSLL